MSQSETLRAAFEKLEKRNSTNLKRDETGQYENPCTQSAWEGFMAGAAHAASAQSAPVAQGIMPPLPAPTRRAYGLWYSEDEMSAYGQQCAEAARQPAPALTEDQKLLLKACIETAVAFEILSRDDADAILASTQK